MAMSKRAMAKLSGTGLSQGSEAERRIAEGGSGVVDKASEARRNMSKVSLNGDTLHYSIVGRHGAARVVMRPASDGTGIIAGGTMRAIFEAAGVKNVLAKVIGTTNPVNVSRATLDGLRRIRSPQETAAMRGKTVDQITG